jgi:hypothetical protein
VRRLWLAKFAGSNFGKTDIPIDWIDFWMKPVAKDIAAIVVRTEAIGEEKTESCIYISVLVRTRE